MFKDLMVPITGTAGDSDAIDIAIGVAKAHNSHVCALEIVYLPMPMASPWGVAPDLSINELYREIRRQGEERAKRLEARLKKESITAEVKLVESLFTEPSRVAADHAHCADLTVVAGSAGDTADAATTLSFVGALLMESGRPVLVVPAGCKTPMPPRRVVVGWRPTREAARALHDALALLVSAETVDLVLVDPVGDDAGADVAAHLQYHGINVNVVVRASRHMTVSSILLNQARETGAQLLVVGGYGHSRLREWALGGVTRELLAAGTMPVFFSH